MKKLFLLLAALLMLSSCDFLGMFKAEEEAKDTTPAYVGTWTCVGEFDMTDTFIFTEDTFEWDNPLASQKGTMVATNNTITFTTTHIKAEDGTFVPVTAEVEEMLSAFLLTGTTYTWSIDENELTVTFPDSTESVYTKQ